MQPGMKISFAVIKKLFSSCRSPKCNLSMLLRSGSVPNLSEKARITSPLLKPLGSPNNRRTSRHHHNHHHHNHRHHGSMVQRTSSYLHPGLLRYHRHAISVDETSPLRHLNDSTHGSQCSVTFDPTPEIIDIAPVHKKRHPKRSDTARKHMLARQRQIEKEEQQQNAQENHKRRRSSTMSENSILSEKAELRRASTASRTNSIDSRCTQNASSVNDLYARSPEKQQSPIKAISDLSIERWVKTFFEQYSLSFFSNKKVFKSQLNLIEAGISCRKLSNLIRKVFELREMFHRIFITSRFVSYRYLLQCVVRLWFPFENAIKVTQTAVNFYSSHKNSRALQWKYF